MAKHGRPRSSGSSQHPKQQPMYTPSYWIDAAFGDGRKKPMPKPPAKATGQPSRRRKTSWW